MVEANSDADAQLCFFMSGNGSTIVRCSMRIYDSKDQ